MNDAPTPRVDAILAKIPGGQTCDPQLVADELRPMIVELERELAAITCKEGELWELRQANARMRDNLASLSKLHADEMTKAQKSLERELAAERALADRLAESIDRLSPWLGESSVITQALAAWKASRDHNQTKEKP